VPDNEALLDEFRFKPRCEWCGRLMCNERLHPHHIFGRGMGGWSRMDVRINLVGLCAEDHAAHHNGQRPLTIDLLAIVAAREKTTQDAIRDEINCLRWGRRA